MEKKKMKRDIWDAEHKCHVCKKVMKKKMFKMEGFKIRGWECPKCKEGVLISEDLQPYLIFNQLKKGIKAKVGELGSSLIVRFPKEIADFFKIHKGQDVIFKANDNKLEIETGR